jgi:hypothetical protein
VDGTQLLPFEAPAAACCCMGRRGLSALAEEVEETVLVLSEHAEPIEFLLQFDGAASVLAGLLEHAFEALLGVAVELWCGLGGLDRLFVEGPGLLGLGFDLLCDVGDGELALFFLAAAELFHELAELALDVLGLLF